MTPEAGARFVLGLQAGCTADDVKRAFRRLALIFHPDKNPGKNAEEAKTKFQAIVRAKECLLVCREIKESSSTRARGSAPRRATFCSSYSQPGASWKPPTAPSSSWTPQKERPEPAAEPSPRCTSAGYSSGMFAAWICGACEMKEMCGSPGHSSSYAPCCRTKPSTPCFCGHPFEMHGPAHGGAHGGKLRCMQIGCLCGQFTYVPVGAKCTCGHSSTEHDVVPFHACEVPGCSCPTFHSAHGCACGHNWACHRTDIRTRSFTSSRRRSAPTAADPEASDASSSSASPEPAPRRPPSSSAKPPASTGPRRRPSSANIFGRRYSADDDMPSYASKPSPGPSHGSSSFSGGDNRPTRQRPSSAQARAGTTATAKRPPPPPPPSSAFRPSATQPSPTEGMAPPAPVTTPIFPSQRRRPCSAPASRTPPAAPSATFTAKASFTTPESSKIHQPAQPAATEGSQPRSRSNNCKEEASPRPAKAWGHGDTSATAKNACETQAQAQQPSQADTSPDVHASSSRPPSAKTQRDKPSANTTVDTPPRATQSKPPLAETLGQKPPVAETPPTAARSSGRSAPTGLPARRSRPSLAKSRPSSAGPLGKQPSKPQSHAQVNAESATSSQGAKGKLGRDRMSTTGVGNAGHGRGSSRIRHRSRSAASLLKGAASVATAAEAAVAAARDDGRKWWERLHTCGKVRPNMSSSQHFSQGSTSVPKPSPVAVPERGPTEAQGHDNPSPSTPIVRRRPSLNRINTSSLKEDSFIFNDDDDASPEPEYFGVDSDDEGEGIDADNAHRKQPQYFEEFASANSKASLPRPSNRSQRPRSAPSRTGTHEQWTRETLWRLNLERNIPSMSVPLESFSTSLQAKAATPVGSGISAVAALSSNRRGESRPDSVQEVPAWIQQALDRVR